MTLDRIEKRRAAMVTVGGVASLCVVPILSTAISALRSLDLLSALAKLALLAVLCFGALLKELALDQAGGPGLYMLLGPLVYCCLLAAQRDRAPVMSTPDRVRFASPAVVTAGLTRLN